MSEYRVLGFVWVLGVLGVFFFCFVFFDEVICVGFSSLNTDQTKLN